MLLIEIDCERCGSPIERKVDDEGECVFCALRERREASELLDLVAEGVFG